ncbi:PEP-CTERM sorting domain-containing protein [Massilia sp. W12]|uniref:PEP-CTERM sorting domain-containing protein n=1 Tax=Massilia sp. W12 TaxID=3126507 RepID=UPI0030CB5C82
MKKLILASLLGGAFVMSAQAAHITELNDGTALNMQVLNYFGSGPQNLDANTVWTSNSTNSVYGYTNGYGFAGNGSWSGASVTMVGSNSPSAKMTFTFNTPVMAFGGFMNYATGSASYGTPVIAAYDANGALLESYTLNFNTGGGTNTGEFHGFRQNAAVIKSFTMTGAYIGGANFRVNAVPEAETYAMMLAGLAGLGLLARRRRQA